MGSNFLARQSSKENRWNMAILSNSRTDFKRCRGSRSNSRFIRSCAADGMVSMWLGRFETFVALGKGPLVGDAELFSSDLFTVWKIGN